METITEVANSGVIGISKEFAMAIIMTLGTIGPAFTIGWIASRGLEAMGRNPEASNSIQTAMTLSIAFAEAIAIYALVTALIIKFV